jgi:hypothetical protein
MKRITNDARTKAASKAEQARSKASKAGSRASELPIEWKEASGAGEPPMEASKRAIWIQPRIYRRWGEIEYIDIWA